MGQSMFNVRLLEAKNGVLKLPKGPLDVWKMMFDSVPWEISKSSNGSYQI